MTVENVRERLVENGLDFEIKGPVDMTDFVLTKEILNERPNLNKLAVEPNEGEIAFYFPGVTFDIGKGIGGEALAFYADGRPSRIYLFNKEQKNVERVLDFEYQLIRDFNHPLSNDTLKVVETNIKVWKTSSARKKNRKEGIILEYGIFGHFDDNKIESRKHFSIGRSVLEPFDGSEIGKRTREFREKKRIYTFSRNNSITYVARTEEGGSGLLEKDEKKSNIKENLSGLFSSDVGLPIIRAF